MLLPKLLNSMHITKREVIIDEILQLNQKSQKYGLTLTEQDAKEIIEARNQALQNYERVELGFDVTLKLIETFCRSPLMHQEEYTSTLKDLQEIFYYLKNETDDEIGDDQLITILKNYYDHTCGGSTDLLKNADLESLARDMRKRKHVEDQESESFNN